MGKQKEGGKSFVILPLEDKYYEDVSMYPSNL